MNYLEQAKKELARATKSLKAARMLLENQLYEDCVSRSYYAVLHAAKAALIKIGVEAKSHQALKRMFGLHLIKTNRLRNILQKFLPLNRKTEKSAITIFISTSSGAEPLKESLMQKNSLKELKNSFKHDLFFVKNIAEALKIALNTG